MSSPSSVEVERLFSRIAHIRSPNRRSLNLSTIEDHLFVKLGTTLFASTLPAGKDAITEISAETIARMAASKTFRFKKREPGNAADTGDDREDGGDGRGLYQHVEWETEYPDYLDLPDAEQLSGTQEAPGYLKAALAWGRDSSQPPLLLFDSFFPFFNPHPRKTPLKNMRGDAPPTHRPESSEWVLKICGEMPRQRTDRKARNGFPGVFYVWHLYRKKSLAPRPKSGFLAQLRATPAKRSYKYKTNSLPKKKKTTALVCGDVKMFSIVEHTLGWLH